MASAEEGDPAPEGAPSAEGAVAPPTPSGETPIQALKESAEGMKEEDDLPYLNTLQLIWRDFRTFFRSLWMFIAPLALLPLCFFGTVSSPFYRNPSLSLSLSLADAAS